MFAVFVLSGVLDVGVKFRVQCLRFSMWDVVPEGFRILRFCFLLWGSTPCVDGLLVFLLFQRVPWIRIP